MDAEPTFGPTPPMWLRVLDAGLATAASEPSEAAAIAATVALLCEPMPFVAAWYGVADFRTRSMRALAGAGLLHGLPTASWSVPNFAQTMQGRAVVTRQPQVEPSSATDRVLHGLDQPPASLGLDVSVCMPVLVGDDVIGLLTAYGASQPAPILDLMRDLAADLGHAIAAVRGDADAPRPAVPGFLTTVAEAHTDPIVVQQAVRNDAGDITDFRFVECNGIGAAMLLHTRSSLIGAMGTLKPIHHDDVVLREAMVEAIVSQTPRLITDAPLLSSDTKRDDRFDIRVLPQRDLVLCSWQEVTERYEAQQVTRMVAQRDHLTGLGSRLVFVDELEEQMAKPRRRNHGVAVLVVAIDGLSRINEALSLAAGDAVIQSIGRRLVEEVGHERLVGRLSGDEFAVILPDEPGPDAALLAAERVQSRISTSISLHGQQFVPSVSIGINYSTGEGDPSHVLHIAGLAMRQAKMRGRGRIEFADPQLAVDARERLAIEHGIRAGLEHDEFRAWFQPIVDLTSREVRGYEALVRWESEQFQVGPSRFIPIAETTGTVPDIDLVLLAQSLKLLNSLPRDHFVSVNVSVASLGSPEYLVAASTLIAGSGIDPARIHLEVTETALVGDLTNTVRGMERLASYGSPWYLDDFGTGYSSVSHLRDLPISGLKLDMSFAMAIASGDASAVRLTQGLMGLARGLGLATIAEGIEEVVTADTLLAQGWGLGQGWLFGKAQRLSWPD